MFIIHPTFVNYSADPETGDIKTKKGLIIKGRVCDKGYYMFSCVNNNKLKHYYVHRFIWECVHGLLDRKAFINHINGDKKDNRIVNLEFQEHRKNAHRNYDFVADNWKKKKEICATNVETNIQTFYSSLYKCSKDLGINAGVISMCCRGVNGVKTGKSKSNGGVYKFEYTD